MFDNIESLKGKYFLIKGNIQSGKTKFMIHLTNHFLSFNYQVLIIIRDRKSDYDQLYERFQQQPKNLFISLSNHTALTKISKLITNPYILFIDEVDYVDSTEQSKKYKMIKELKDKSYFTIGITATAMDPIGKEQISYDQIIILEKDPHYYGINDIEMLEISNQCKYTGKIKSNLFETDIDLLPFMEEYSKRQPTHIPNICLINICRTKEPCERVQKINFPHLAIIIYNSNGISFLGKIYKQTISSFLQYLKDNGGIKKYPNIIIFSGDLAGRCISFVSSDFKWHLTDMRLLVSPGCDEPELIQKIRLCGIYSEKTHLRLYTTFKIINDLKKAYLRQEELLHFIQLSKTQNAKDFIDHHSISFEKMTKRSITKDKQIQFKMKVINGQDDGWLVDDYKVSSKQIEIEVNKEINIVEKFKKWSVRKDLRIYSFLSHLDPDKEYTKDQIQSILFGLPLKHLMIDKYKKSLGYGKIIKETNGKYYLYPELKEDFNHYFK